MAEFDTSYTREITCPYCGYVHSDSWEFAPDGDMEASGEWDCGRCEKEFHIQRNVEITFTTSKLEAATE